MHFVTGIAHIFIRERVAFIALAPVTVHRVLGYISAEDGIIEEADREIIGPSLAHGSRLNLSKTTGARLSADQPVGDAVAVFVNYHLAVVVAIQIIGKGRGGASEYAHPHAGRYAFGRWRERSVILSEAILCFRDDSVTADAALAEIVGLEISGGLIETQAVVVIVRGIYQVKEVGSGSALEFAWIQPNGTVAEGKIEHLARTRRPAILQFRVRHWIRLIESERVEKNIHVVAGGHCSGGRQPSIRKCHQLPGASLRRRLGPNASHSGMHILVMAEQQFPIFRVDEDFVQLCCVDLQE